jgi:transcription initiation factor IIF auxiliary subunit
MNFLQAVKIYKAEEAEKAVSLHKQHHEQTVKSLDYFKSAKNQENIQSISRKNLSPAENKAISNINAILKIAPTEQKKMALQRALDLIKKGTYGSKGLPKSINDFFTSNQSLLKEPSHFIDQLFIEVLDRYDLSSNADEPKESQPFGGIVNPKIVLTQSFV